MSDATKASDSSLAASRERIDFIDAMRGLVIVLMAIDHVRIYWGPTAFELEDLTQTTPAWFLTRYVTHFCAPVFVFLAGVSAGLYARNVERSVLVRFLLTRGAWLVFLECTVVSLSWGALLGGVVLLQVIWALGISMIALALLIHLPRSVLVLVIVLIVAGHNALDDLHPADFGRLDWLWSLLHQGGTYSIGSATVLIKYPVLPWIGVMAAGYIAAPWLLGDPCDRQRRLLVAGATMLMIMLVLRSANLYGDPRPWEWHERGGLFSFFSFINFEKYPPSLLFLCITLGIGVWTMAYLASISSERLQWLLVLGRVPMFFYLVHLPLIHVGAQIWSWARYHQLAGWGFSGATAPTDYAADLLFVYAVCLTYLLGLYFLCQCYGNIKKRRPTGLLRYL